MLSRLIRKGRNRAKSSRKHASFAKPTFILLHANGNDNFRVHRVVLQDDVALDAIVAVATTTSV
jgi:hypothetical protein